MSNNPFSGIKYDQHKPRFDLLPSEALEEVAIILTFGAEKYGAHNWKGGIVYSRLVAAALRHIYAFLRGETIDPESGRPHIAHAICNLMFILYFMRVGPASLDDRYKKEEDKKIVDINATIALDRKSGAI